MNRRRTRAIWTLAGLSLLVGSAIVIALTRHGWHVPLWTNLRGRYTIAERLATYGLAADSRLVPAFASNQVAYPPKFLALVVFKDRRILHVFARDEETAPWVKIRQSPIVGLSGSLGPKLTAGDRQVPEGRYQVESLNPNSRFHLALRLNYPNEFDIARAKEDGRTKLGSDIMIHGGELSIGCLAMGDEAAEELFILSARTGIENVSVLISPTDFRVGSVTRPKNQPAWIGGLYDQIREELGHFPIDN